MEITTTVNLRGVNNLLKRVSVKAADEKRALKIAAIGHVREIKTRTAKGVGVKGRFKPYSQFWAGVRSNPTPAQKKKYRSGGGHRTDIVNLNFTGNMLHNLNVVDVTSNKAIIGFSSASERDKAEANQKTRPFMGITSDEQELIVKRFKKALFK